MMKIIYKLLDPAFLCGLAFFSIIMVFILVFFCRKKSTLSKIILAYFIIVSILIFSINLFVKDPYRSQFDSYNFNLVAVKVANNIKSDPINIFSYLPLERKAYHNPPYIILLTIIYIVFYNSMIAGELFSALCGALTLYQLYYFTEFIYNKRTALYTTFMLAISPFYIYLSTRLLRETLCLLTIVTFFRLWQKQQRHFAWKNVISMGLLILFLLFLRAQFAALLMLVVAIYGLSFIFFRRIGLKGLLTVASSITLGMFLLINYRPEILQNTLLEGFKYAQLERMEAREEFSSEISFSYAEPVKFNSFVDIINSIPKMSFYFMTVPLPWHVFNAKLLVCLLDSGALWFIYLLAIFDARTLWQGNRKWALILFSYLAIGIAGASLLQANISNAMRHRLPFTIFILPLAAHRLVLWWEKRRGRIAVRKPLWAPGVGRPLASRNSGPSAAGSGRVAPARRL
ncbi:MAG: glycosyltransferase family 39 protein [Deltaproteobacteria bacterium]|nr:glycosyltransferase family 39 protein [Deltaproteobacteria bacterium]